jgi:hypothetical protein
MLIVRSLRSVSSYSLNQIMNLRGLKRNEQESLVNTYNTTVGPEDQLKLKAERSDKFSSIFSQLRNN